MFSCPICPATFTASPLLYDHLQQMHSEQTSQFKKPKGREGKTILYRDPMPSLPVISPMMIVSCVTCAGVTSDKCHIRYTCTADTSKPVTTDTLFLDKLSAQTMLLTVDHSRLTPRPTFDPWPFTFDSKTTTNSSALNQSLFSRNVPNFSWIR